MPQTPKQPDQKFNVRLPGDLGEAIRLRAAQEERSANNLIRRALKEYVGLAPSSNGTPAEAEDDPVPPSRQWGVH